MQYDAEMYSAVNTTLYRYFAWVGGFYQVGSIVATAALAVLVRARMPSFAWTVVGAVCLLLAFGMWLTVVAPREPRDRRDPSACARVSPVDVDGTAASLGVWPRGGLRGAFGRSLRRRALGGHRDAGVSRRYELTLDEVSPHREEHDRAETPAADPRRGQGHLDVADRRRVLRSALSAGVTAERQAGREDHRSSSDSGKAPPRPPRHARTRSETSDSCYRIGRALAAEERAPRL